MLRPCSRCGAEHDRIGQRYCLKCFAEYMRVWRKTHPMSEEQRFRDSARSTANHARKRGKLVPEPCIACGAREVQMHHEDYTKPLEVHWLCVECHRVVTWAEKH